MLPPPQIDIHTLGLIYRDDRDQIVQSLLSANLELDEIKILLGLHLVMKKQPIVNAIRYRIGRYLWTRHCKHQTIADHFNWAKSHLEMSEFQNRRFRRHSKSVDDKVLEGMDILDALKLPSLTLWGAKSRKDRAVEQNLDALRSLRGDLKRKIVTK